MSYNTVEPPYTCTCKGHFGTWDSVLYIVCIEVVLSLEEVQTVSSRHEDIYL